MQFGNPLALWTLLVIPAAMLAVLWRMARRRRSLERLGARPVVDRLSAESVEAWRMRRVAISLAILCLLALGAARPQYGRIEQSVRRAGLDVILAIDVSPSMLAQDLEPNRLEQAREALRRLLLRLRGNRVGIIAFAGEAHLLCPMTDDVAIAQLVLRSIDQNTVGLAGTDLGRVIEVAHGAFRRGGSGSHVLVLITDGEDNEGRGLAAARAAAGEMSVFAVGIGTDRGGPVPEGRGFKDAPEGGKVVTRLDIETLTAIVGETGGVAFAAGDNPVAAVDAIVSEIDRMEKVMRETRTFIVYQDRFGWFVAPALALLAWLLLTRPPQHDRPRPAFQSGNPTLGRRAS